MGRGVVVKKSKVLQVLRELGATQKTVAVGILGTHATEQHTDVHGKPEEATVAQVATWNHYGTSTIPPRPFLQWMLAQHGAELKKLQARLAGGLVQGKIGLDQALGLLGEAAVGFAKKTIADGIPPRNAPATIAKKGSSTPLIDSGQLRGSITWQIKEGGGDGH